MTIDDNFCSIICIVTDRMNFRIFVFKWEVTYIMSTLYGHHNCPVKKTGPQNTCSSQHLCLGIQTKVVLCSWTIPFRATCSLPLKVTLAPVFTFSEYKSDNNHVLVSIGQLQMVQKMNHQEEKYVINTGYSTKMWSDLLPLIICKNLDTVCWLQKKQRLQRFTIRILFTFIILQRQHQVFLLLYNDLSWPVIATTTTNHHHYYFKPP